MLFKKRSADQPQDNNNETASEPADSKKHRSLSGSLILLAFPALLLLAIGVTYYAYTQRDETVTIDGRSVDTASLSQEDLARLAAEQAEIDNTNKVLSVAANSVFDGTMLVKSSLDVQGQLRVGQELSLNDLAVAGQSTLNNLDVAGDTNLQGDTLAAGNLSVQNNLVVSGSLTVGGGGSFAGNLTANSIETGSLSFSGDLIMNGHVITAGAQTTASRGGAVGGGGTVSVSGNDTAGTVNINTGGGTSSGILVNIGFGRAYSSTPRVIITPVGPGAGQLNWYVVRSSSGFSIRTTNAPAGSANFAFDYFVIQ